MDNEQYAYVLGALARIDRKIDFLIEANKKTETLGDADEFEDEFNLS